jgi:hypothetical protein
LPQIAFMTPQVCSEPPKDKLEHQPYLEFWGVLVQKQFVYTIVQNRFRRYPCDSELFHGEEQTLQVLDQLPRKKFQPQLVGSVAEMGAEV